MSTGPGVLLVTGGSRGIGAAVCRLAAAAGYVVALSYHRDAGAAQSVVDAISADGGRAHAFRADVGCADDITRLFHAVEAAAGAVGALVNNAGITGRIGPFAQLPLDVLRTTLDVNVVGTMLCSQVALRRWLERGTAGVIVNISSTAATLGAPGEYVHYAASKAAVDAFTLGLAREVAAHGIRVNAVAPGTTRTDIHAAGGDPGRAERVAPKIPLQRAAEPDEIAQAVAWLLSPQASYVTGAILRAGGGL